MTDGRRIVDLRPDAGELIEQVALFLGDAFRDRTEDWQDPESARREVLDSLEPDRISRVLVDESGRAAGWIGGIPMYGGRRALVEDFERLVAPRGALTLWAGSDDENNETTLSGRDLYPDIPGSIRSIRNLGHHPYEFYLRMGFRIAGVLPDANGLGKPDIFLAKRVGA